MSLEGIWVSENIKLNKLNYINGQYEFSNWNLELNILSKISNQYICKLTFINPINSNKSGMEFLLLSFDEKNNKIYGADSNSIINGSLDELNNELYISSTGIEHIKNNKHKFINSYETIFYKKMLI